VIRIAHLSDLHFGKKFDFPTWEAVTHTVIEFGPDLIVVSGDLVDHPLPAHLLAAKCALRELSQKAADQSRKRAEQHPGTRPRAAELIVIPGNHDVFESGLSVSQPRIKWFERIFHSTDTALAEQNLSAELKCEVGFNKLCLHRQSMAKSILAKCIQIVLGFAPAQDFTSDIPSNQKPLPAIQTPIHSPVLLALLD
jgi:DNA repair exonuclease SbcCD nuclease subunit